MIFVSFLKSAGFVFFSFSEHIFIFTHIGLVILFFFKRDINCIYWDPQHGVMASLSRFYLGTAISVMPITQGALNKSWH